MEKKIKNIFLKKKYLITTFITLFSASIYAEHLEEDKLVFIAEAVLDKKHSNISGAIKFFQNKKGNTLIKGRVYGLVPGKYGFHIHEKGDISTGCKAAGGHYNPFKVDHGNIVNGHVGDLGNIINTNGKETEIYILAKRISLEGEFSVIGRSIMVHGKVDDLGLGNNEGSKKTGNAGPRIGCGVIKAIIK